MVPPGPPTPIGGSQSVSPSLMRSNSGMMGGQGGQASFPSLVSQRNQFNNMNNMNNMNMLGNMSNVASMMNQSFSNGIPNSGMSGMGSGQRGGMDAGAEQDPLSGVGNGMGFGNQSSSFGQSNVANPGSSGQGQGQGQQFSNPSGNQLLSDQQHSQQLDVQNFQHGQQQSAQQFSAPMNTQQHQQNQQHFQSMRGGIGGIGPVKMEPQGNNDQFGQHQLSSLRNLAQVKMEPQQLQTMRGMSAVKMEPQHNDQPFLHQQQQQQQQQQLLHMSRQTSQATAAQMNLLQQQRILQFQQQQQLLKSMPPQQRSQLPQQFQQQNMPVRSPAKPAYEPGMCARRLTHYMYQQQHRPEDNNIEFWRKFVAEYFAPNAKKKWCVSMYGSGRQTTGVFPQDIWHCEICNRKPGRGFEATAEVLPRLFKIKYESGTLEELLYVDMPREYHNSSGQIVLDYAKAIQESVFEQLRVVRDGQLRIVFSPDLKICSWEFCARRHEELIPRRLLIPQVSQLGAVAQKYQACTQNAAANQSVPELQNNCNMFVASARQLAKALEVPLVNDLGYTKRYVRCLQISEVVNSMKDLIDYSRETGTGPMDSLAKFPRRTSNSSGLHNQAQQSEDQLQQQQQHMVAPNSNGDQNSVQAAAMQMPSNNGVASVNNNVNSASASTTTSTIVGLLHQNSMNARQQNSMNNASSPYGGSSAHIPSPGSCSTVPQAQPNSSPFHSPTPSSSNNNPQTSHPGITSANHMGTVNSPANISMQQQQTSISGDADPSNDAQNSVQKIIHDMMLSSQMNGTGGMVGANSLGNDMKNVNGILPVNTNTGLNGGNGMMSNGGVNSNSGVGVGGYGGMGLGPSGLPNGMRPGMGNNSVMNGRGGMASIAREQAMNHQQDLSSQLLIEYDSSIVSDLHLDNLSHSPGSEDKQFAPSFSFDSTGYSSVKSPPIPRQKHAKPNVSPELLHLVDSAIMGKPEGIDKLKNIASGVEIFESGEEMDNVPFLIVDSLLATMGGVESFEEDEDNPPSVMLNSRAAIVSGELIPWLPYIGDTDDVMSPRTRMVRGLLAIIRACTRNRAMCSSAGLLGVLLRTAEKIFTVDVGLNGQMRWDGTPLCHCIQFLAGHSLSVSDLYRWFQVITKTLTTIWAPRLTLALEKAISGKESRGPACTFEFDGESSGLLGPGESRWPFVSGYAFATWIYIESFADTLNTATVAAAIAAAASARSGKSSAMSAAAAASALAGEGTVHMPRLFSFLSGDNQGIEAYFHAQFLVVETASGKGKKSSLHFTYAFKPQCWYFIGLEHIGKHGILGNTESEVRLYVDGSLYESRPFEFPRISKPLAFCCIGTNPPPTMAGLQRRRRQCPLFAEMGPVYIFKEPIGPERMAGLASRGGDILPSFGNAAGLPWLSTNAYVQSKAEESVLLDAEIGGFIHLLYHPSLLNGRFCPDASPSGASGVLRRPAEVLGQVHVATRMRPGDALWALAYGGPLSLLPVTISNIDEDTLEPVQGNLSLSSATTSLAAPIFRIISMAIQHSRNNEELSRGRGPEVLSKILNYLLQTLSSLEVGKHEGVGDEELVAAVVSVCQSQKINHTLKVQLFTTLLLDLKIWSLCSYGIQKKLLSSLADMVFTESTVMRDANAIQMLLDGCRQCYWIVREIDSVNSFSLAGATRPVGEINALVDELLVVVELLIVAAPPSLVSADVRCLLGFMVDCPQPNQVARVLHLFYRMVVQPNASRANTFAEEFLAGGGIETLLVLLQREAKAGDSGVMESFSKNPELEKTEIDGSNENTERSQDDEGSEDKSEASILDNDKRSQFIDSGNSPHPSSPDINSDRMAFASETSSVKNLGGISLSISADSARKNVYNIDKSDGIVVGIIGLLGALVASGQLRFVSCASPDTTSNLYGVGLHDRGGTMFEDKVSLLLYALQKAFQAAPNRLMTDNVYTALLAASINASSLEDGLNFYDSGHRFEHSQLLLVLLHSLPFAPRSLQSRALQDLLFLACSHPENRNSMINMEEWPEWILEILISSYEVGPSKLSDSTSVGDVEDLIHNFLIIMLEHSMRQKDGWKDIEATIHCAEWLSIVGGSSTGEQRVRREESLPIFKRRLLGSLLDFAARELQVQTQIIAAAAAGVAAEGLSPTDAKAEADNAAQLSVALVENAIVILMLVEDHLRLQSKQSSSRTADISPSPLTTLYPISDHSTSLSTIDESTEEVADNRSSLSGGSGGNPLDALSSMADGTGQIPTSVMERIAAAAAAEPYESVSCAFVSHGSCAKDLAAGWKYRSRLWYGVGLPQNPAAFGGGGSGWDFWKSTLEKDASGNWIELPLVRKSVAMLQALLLDESGLGGGLGIGGGSGTGMGGMAALYQLLDSDQPFLCMLRMVLLSMREDDNGEDYMLMRNSSIDDVASEGRKPRSALLWSVLSPVLNMPISDSKRQRVLVASCVLYAEVYHAVSRDQKPLRKQYLEAILPPFVAVLRRWRPLLASIHELATGDGLNPLVADDRALAADSLPIEAALAMISPAWAAAFASPPAAMALAMIAAGASGGESQAPAQTSHLRRDTSLLERKQTRLHTFSSFQRPLEVSNKTPPLPKDKAAAKAAALAAARDLERFAKIGSGRGLSAVAMATSAQRRSASDMERVNRWNISEAMGVAWMECLQPAGTKSVYGKDFNAFSYKYIAVLVASFALARNMQRSEVDRRAYVDIVTRHRISTGVHAWRKLIHQLIEMRSLFGPSADNLYSPLRVFWKLDLMESSSRMRRCLRRNYQGSDHLGSAADYEEYSEEKNDQSTPILSAEAISLEAVNEDEEQVDAENLVDRVDDVQNKGDNQLSISESAEQSVQASLESSGPQHASDEHIDQSSSAIAPGYVPSELDERIVLELPTSMVRPLKVIRGTFQVTSRRINFIVDNYSNETSAATDGFHSSFEAGNQEKDRSWLMSSLHQIYSRRYLLRRSALELFMVDRSNFFFDFGSSEGRRNAYRAIVQARPPHLNNIYLATQRPDQLLKRTQLMERWARWEISNFEYLMQLNTLAGRSYNDITQYPVFPWILSDYNSESLDISNPSSFRDLSKPVGALNPDRLKRFQERYASFDDPVIPKFHYGSHYSSAGTVLYYLVRVEPFTTLAIQLQGGKFDHADRMFSDISGTWNGVLEDMSDVKELVPELFYQPEVLTNENSIDFGTTQLGGKLDTVKLPAWAENPIDFIHKHRKALESEYASSHLHEWIDLIFGYKQRGKEAVAANNVFFYITYEGTVDIDKISDPVQQRATQDQIAYFGQTPSQLLTVPHLKKMPLAEVLHLQTIFRNPNEVKPYVVPSPERCNLPAAAIHASSDAVVVVDMNAPAAHVAEHKWQPNTPDGHGTPFLFQHRKVTAGSAGGALMRMFKAPVSSGEEWRFPQAVAFSASGIRSQAIVSITCDKEIITGGHADNSIRLISSDGAKTLETAYGHCAPVTCLGLSPDSNYLVTGSRDTTVLLWRIHRVLVSHSNVVSEHSTGTGTLSPTSKSSSHLIEKNRRRRIEGPIQVLRGHRSEIISCCVNSNLGIVVSCSHSSDVLLHSIRRGRLIRRLDGVEADIVCLSSEGVVVTWNESQHTLSTFTLNGTPIARAQFSFFCSISCMQISNDGMSALIGINSQENGRTYNNGLNSQLNKSGVDFDSESEETDENSRTDLPSPSICFLDMHTLEVFHILRLGEGQDITALTLNQDNTNLLVSTLDKQLIIFTDPSLSLKVVDQMLKLGWEGNGLQPLIKS